MATTNLGKVSVTPKGAWNSSNAYEKLDIVTSGGNGYIALKDVPSGTAITNTSYWLKFADKGDKGDTGEINGASASISGGYGSPSVSVTEGGTSTDRSFAFAFSNLKGNGIESIVLQGTSGAEKTYRITFSDGTHFDFVVTDGEVTEESLVETLESYAQIDGYYEDLTSGSTEEVISNVKITDQEPYTFRTSGGNAEIGSREEDTLVGVSVAFNQLAYGLDQLGVNGATMVGTAEEATLTVNNVGVIANRIRLATSGERVPTAQAMHRYYITSSVKSPLDSSYARIQFGNSIMLFKYNLPKGEWVRAEGITYSSDPSGQYLQVDVWGSNDSSFAVGDVVGIKDYQIVDLTLMFGSDIADYLYTLEQAQAGEGVALAKKLGLNKYLGYNAGTLYSAQTDAHKMVGFNQWDVANAQLVQKDFDSEYVSPTNVTTKAYMDLLPNITYAWTQTTFNDGGARYVRFYDGNHEQIGSINLYGNGIKTFTTPDGTRYGRLMWYHVNGVSVAQVESGEVCISIHWDNSRDTDYEPYVLHNYPIDPVVLRGILKKDADGNIYADGDVYHNDGTVDRNMKSITFDGTELDTYWSLYTDANNNLNQFYTSPEVITDVRVSTNGNISTVCDKFASISISDRTSKGYGTCYTGINAICFNIDPSIASTVAEWKTWLQSHPVTVEYYTTEPATEQATPFTTPQIVDNWGTEEYPDYAVAHGDREYSVPMGHTTLYPISIRDKVEASADNPSNDGVYILQMSGGKATYIPLIIEDELPTMPTQDGTYTLKTVVSSGTATLSWVAE